MRHYDVVTSLQEFFAAYQRGDTATMQRLTRELEEYNKRLHAFNQRLRLLNRAMWIAMALGGLILISVREYRLGLYFVVASVLISGLCLWGERRERRWRQAEQVRLQSILASREVAE
jgi:hypothetical protein